MQIAVILENKCSIGGGFQQELATACLLNKYHAHSCVFYTTRPENVKVLKAKGIKAKYINTRSLLNKVHVRLIRHRSFYEAFGRVKTSFENALIKDKIDLVFFLSPSWLALSLKRLNFVLTFWDLCHRDHPEFPEVRAEGEFAIREEFVRHAVPQATAVVTNFESLKKDLVRRYGCDEDKIHVAQLLPAVGIQAQVKDIRIKYALKNPYIFYPAQFWAHKNHVYVIDALKILKDKGVVMDAVFSGSDQGNLTFVLDYAQQQGLGSAVHYVGFVPNEEISSFYQHAVALVMPTYYGPTNIPPLEAFALGVPVCYSNLPGLRDQVGQAAFLLDLDQPADLARHILTILNDPKAAAEKVKLGKQLISSWTEDDYYQVLKKIFDAFGRKMRCWKND